MEKENQFKPKEPEVKKSERKEGEQSAEELILGEQEAVADMKTEREGTKKEAEKEDLKSEFEKDLEERGYDKEEKFREMFPDTKVEKTSEKDKEYIDRMVEEKVRELREEDKKEAQLSKELSEDRKNYAQAMKLRGKAFFRKVFKGKEGEKKLRESGEKYEEALQKAIAFAIARELKGEKLEGEELTARIADLAVEMHVQETEAREKEAAADKHRFEKFREIWENHPWARVFIGVGLAVGSVSSMGTGSLLMTAARVPLSGLGAGMGADALISKLSRSIGEKGLINKLEKENRPLNKKQRLELSLEAEKESLEKMGSEQPVKGLEDIRERKIERAVKKIERLNEKIEKINEKIEALGITPLQEKVATLSEGQVKNELARIRALAARKGIELEKVGGKYGEIIGALKQRESEIFRENVEKLLAEAKGEKDKNSLIAMAVENSLVQETKEMDKRIESKTDEARKKAIARGTVAITTGLLTAGLTAFIAFENYQDAVVPAPAKETVEGATAAKEGLKAGAVEGAAKATKEAAKFSTEYVIQNGDTPLSIVNMEVAGYFATPEGQALLKAKYGLLNWNDVDPQRKAFIIEEVKNWFEKAQAPEVFKPGYKVSFSGFLEKGQMGRVFDRVMNRSVE